MEGKGDGFFVRWKDGMKSYYSSVSGLLFLKLIFLGFVVFGLFAGSVQMFLRGDFWWFGFISLFFGLVMLVDFRLLFINYLGVKKFEGLS